MELYTYLPDNMDMRYKIGRYYSIFKESESLEPIVTVPYVDYFKLGKTVSSYLTMCYCKYFH